MGRVALSATSASLSVQIRLEAPQCLLTRLKNLRYTTSFSAIKKRSTERFLCFLGSEPLVVYKGELRGFELNSHFRTLGIYNGIEAL